MNSIILENIEPDMTLTLQVHGVVAIPIGHRIEIRILKLKNKNHFFNKDEVEPIIEFPLITDMETGVRYGALNQFYDLNHIYNIMQLFDAKTTPLEYYTVYKIFYGVVENCNVLTAKMEGIQTQTTLVIRIIQKPISKM